MIPVLLKYPSGPPTLISSDFAMSDVPKTISLPMQHYQEIVSDGDIGNMIWRLAWRFHECSMDLWYNTQRFDDDSAGVCLEFQEDDLPSTFKKMPQSEKRLGDCTSQPGKPTAE